MRCGDPTPEQLAAWIGASACTAAFAGAGVWTAAGIPDFRGPGGLYAAGKDAGLEEYTPQAAEALKMRFGDP